MAMDPHQKLTTLRSDGYDCAALGAIQVEKQAAQDVVTLHPIFLY